MNVLTTAKTEEIIMSKSFANLIPLIVVRSNMDEAFNEVIDDLEKERKELYESRREQIIAYLSRVIANGTFRITEFEEFDVKEGEKIRRIQSPRVRDRIGCNAIMRIVELFLYPSIIPTSAASIKGRGMHRLYRKMRTDIRHNRKGTRYYYKCDIRKFYESIPQQVVINILREKIHDPVLLPILESFAQLMPKGLSIGLRSSQCYGNLVLSPLDHRMKEREGCRYYYRYCDDIVILADRKRKLWHWRDVVHEEVERLGLEIKPDEAVRPITESIDFLGYVDDGKHSRLRKRTKKKAARKLAKVKSRKRRQKIIGSFKGMAKWGDCNHLYKILTGKNMKDIGEVDIALRYSDGKKHFKGKTISPRELEQKGFVVVDYERDVIPRMETEKYEQRLAEARMRGEDETKVKPPVKKWVISILFEGKPRKMWTGIEENKCKLVAMEKQGAMPFFATIASDFSSGKYPFYTLTSATAQGLKKPDDAEIEKLIKFYNMR